MIPLRDANPVRRTPIITIATIVACVVAFAYTQGVEASQGIEGVDKLFETWGVVPANLVAGTYALKVYANDSSSDAVGSVKITVP